MSVLRGLKLVTPNTNLLYTVTRERIQIHLPALQLLYGCFLQSDHSDSTSMCSTLDYGLAQAMQGSAELEVGYTSHAPPAPLDDYSQTSRVLAQRRRRISASPTWSHERLKTWNTDDRLGMPCTCNETWFEVTP